MTDEDSPVRLKRHRVEGAPLACTAARLTWAVEPSAVLEREGDTSIRTPDGPSEFTDALAGVEEPYSATQRGFERAIQARIDTEPVLTTGPGPVPAEGSNSGDP